MKPPKHLSRKAIGKPRAHPAVPEPADGRAVGHAQGIGKAAASKQEKVFAADLMHQQCWCWGQDVGSAENLLLRYGFERHRRPEVGDQSGAGGTRYERTGDDGVRVALWGFGMWLRLPGGEQGYFARYERGVRLLPKSFDVSGVHSGRQVEPQLRRPSHSGELAAARELATAAASWCEQYERWVAETEGLDHRRRTLRKWKHAVVGPGDMASAWRRVRGIYERWYRPSHKLDALDPRLSPASVGGIEGFDL